MAQYKCNDCGAKFSPDDFTTYCPECQGENYTKQMSSAQLFFKRYGKIGIIVLVVILALITCVKIIDDDPDVKMAYELRFHSLEDCVEIIFYERELGSTAPRKEVSNRTIIKQLTAFYNIRVYDSRENLLLITDGRFYPCHSPDTLNITWRDNESFPLYRPLLLKEQISWELKAATLNPLACRISLEITGVSTLPQCRLEVKTNYDDTAEKDEVLISITGKQGQYKAQRVWDAKDIKEYNVWAVLKGDTIDFATLNGNRFQGIDCNIVPPNLDELKRLGDLYGSNPANVSHLASFFNVSGINSNTIFFLNNSRIDRASLENAMRVKFQNDNTTFRIAPNGIRISGNNVVEVKFITQKDA